VIWVTKIQIVRTPSILQAMVPEQKFCQPALFWRAALIDASFDVDKSN
jgi:hypothetical protein